MEILFTFRLMNINQKIAFNCAQCFAHTVPLFETEVEKKSRATVFPINGIYIEYVWKIQELGMCDILCAWKV